MSNVNQILFIENIFIFIVIFQVRFKVVKLNYFVEFLVRVFIFTWFPMTHGNVLSISTQFTIHVTGFTRFILHLRQV